MVGREKRIVPIIPFITLGGRECPIIPRAAPTHGRLQGSDTHTGSYRFLLRHTSTRTYPGRSLCELHSPPPLCNYS
jgi:hypothetical protein